MGLRDLIRQAFNGTSAAPAAIPRPIRATQPMPVWVPPHAPVRIGHLGVPGGMFYLGPVPANLRHSGGGGEIIDPALPVDWSRPDLAGAGLDYWPAYHSIPPSSRAAYLSWLANGRRVPDTPIGYVFLFFYGLERRVLVDARADPRIRSEFPSIRAEVDELLRAYGANHSFRSYAGEFRDLLTLLLGAGEQASAGPPPDPADGERYSPPLRLKLGLGEFAGAGRPVPAAWAFAWAMWHPEIYPRTPATRCPAEFRHLFLTRYRERHGSGLVVRPSKLTIALTYRPASDALSSDDYFTNVPDVLNAAVPARKLAELMDACADALDSYSRLLGRRPETAGTLPALALLPPDLLDDTTPALAPLNQFVRAHLRVDGQPVVVDAGALTDLWRPRAAGKFAKADAVGLAQVLERVGVGVEPDVRLGGGVRTAGPMVLFKSGPAQPTAATPEYQAATTLLHLAAFVSAADDEVSQAERDHLVRHLETSLHLSAGERTRLKAHLAWLLAGELKLTGLKKRLSTLSGAQRAGIGEFLTAVAAIDGVISPSEVTTLRKIFVLLELDPELVYGSLHARASGATEPVTVVPADTSPSGYVIPQEVPARKEPAGLVLDHHLIEAKLAESATVSALLADIFADEPVEEEPSPQPAAVGRQEQVADLDAAHSGLLRVLAKRPSWTRAEFEHECAQARLLPDGALDMLNEAAMSIADEPVLEDDGDELRINDYALGELHV